jgi:parallel beta-helix repeat protein
MSGRMLCASVLTLLAVGLLVFGFGIRQVKSLSKTWIVDDDGPADFSKIQDAIDAASPEDVISVKAGTYNENVEVNKKLTLVGEGAEATTINALDQDKHTINVSSSDVVISGFKISGSHGVDPIYGSGIRLSHVDNVSLFANHVTDNLYGIYVEYSNNNTVENNVVDSNSWGINLEIHASYNAIIWNNASSNSIYGIVLWAFSNNNFVAHNIVSGNNMGVTLGYADNNMIVNNTISKNSGAGIEIQGVSNDNVVFHNEFVDNNVQAGGDHISDSVNLWDDGYPSGGNYWSDYTQRYSNASEIDGSGIWDTPYAIDSNNADNYPIIPEFQTWFVPALFMMATVLTAMACRRKSHSA